MPVSSWSTTPSSNATADSASGITWPENMNPAQVNDSARAMMAEIKKAYVEPFRKVSVYNIPSGSTYHDIPLPSGYERYFITIQALTPSVPAVFYARILTPTERTTGYYETLDYTAAANTLGRATRSSVDKFQLTGTVNNTAETGAMVSIELTPGNAVYPHMRWNAAHWLTTLNVSERLAGSGFVNQVGTPTILRVFSLVGTITLGAVTVEGTKSA